MKNKASIIKIIVYIVILVVGLWISLDQPGNRSGGDAPDEQGERIRLKKDAGFIESRSFVTFRLGSDRTIDDINRMFGLTMDEEVYLRYNVQFKRGDLEEKIPAGTILNLYLGAETGPNRQEKDP